MKTAELFPDRMRLAIPLGAFAGLRLGEACGLRVENVDFLRGIIHPKLSPWTIERAVRKARRKVTNLPAGSRDPTAKQRANYPRFRQT